MCVRENEWVCEIFDNLGNRSGIVNVDFDVIPRGFFDVRGAQISHGFEVSTNDRNDLCVTPCERRHRQGTAVIWIDLFRENE